MKTNFLDITKHGFIRVAAVVPLVHLANPKKNAEAHIEQLNVVYADGTHYAVCPELGLTGYSCRDLFQQNVLQKRALQALEMIVQQSNGWPGMAVSVGVPLVTQGALFNCAVTVFEGNIIAVTAKTNLPNYAEFEEKRWFRSARESRSDTISIHGREYPFGNNILISYKSHENCVIHTEICEDGWIPFSPSIPAALEGATILANLSASPITIGKSAYRKQLMQAASGSKLAVQIYTAAGYGESSTDLSWDGDAYIVERGTVRKQGERFAQKGTHIVSDVNLRVIASDRLKQDTFGDNRADLEPRCVTIEIPWSGNDKRQERRESFMLDIDPHPFVPSDPALRNERCSETFMIQSTALRRRLESLPTKDPKIVLGVSGGQDSTHALSVAVHTMDLMGLPRTNIIGVTMKGFGTTDRTKDNAMALMEALGVTCREIPIADICMQTFRDIGYTIPEGKKDLVFENVQAWCRTHILFAISAKEHAIVLGTGDLSELLLGWCTYGGDHLSHYGINAGVPKTLISYLIRWTADVTFAGEPGVQAILRDIEDTPISPELLPPGEDGKIEQKTEDLNGPYELHDFFGYWFSRFGYDPSAIVRIALQAFGGKYEVGEIKKWMLLFIKRYFANQFKRSMAPDGPKVGLVALSPRGDLRMPSDADPTIWIEDVEENVPDKIAV